MSHINKIFLPIKVFKYLYAGFKNVSLEDAETPEDKVLLLYTLRHYINAKISTQTHLIHGIGLGWYKVSFLSKHSTLTSNCHIS